MLRLVATRLHAQHMTGSGVNPGGIAVRRRRALFSRRFGSRCLRALSGHAGATLSSDVPATARRSCRGGAALAASRCSQAARGRALVTSCVAMPS